MTPAFVQPPSLEASMRREERLNLILTFARVLYINGESTQKTLDITERMSNSLGFRTTIFPHWGELEVQTEDTNGKLVSVIEAVPSGGRGRSCGLSGALRHSTLDRSGTHIRECGGRCTFTPYISPLQHKYLSATIQRGTGRWHSWGVGSSI